MGDEKHECAGVSKELEQQWGAFCRSRTRPDGEHWYSGYGGRHGLGIDDDYLDCREDAEDGVPRAVEMMTAFVAWRMKS